MTESIQLIAKLIIDKATQGKKLNTYEYLILLIYYKMIDKRFAESKGYTTGKEFEDRRFTEIKEYADNRFKEANKGFESLKSEIKKEISEINAKLDAIEAKLDKIEKEIKELKDLAKQILALLNQLYISELGLQVITQQVRNPSS